MLLALLACTADDSGAKVCPAPGAIVVEGDPIPGATVTLSAEHAEDWVIGTGETATGESVSWTIPESLAIEVAETVHIEVSGCDGVSEADVVVDHPVGERTVVVYDPTVDGSEEVARAYQAFRDVPAAGMCAVSATNTVEIGAEEFAGWVDQVLACTQPWTHAIVPVWGVPYRVSGQVIEPYGGYATSVSLDALLFFGAAATSYTSWTRNPLYQHGDSMEGDYDPYVPFGGLRGEDGFFLVSRIEGVDSAAAIDLVERTELAQDAADAGTLDGIVYVDGNRGDTPPTTDQSGSYEAGEWNMWGTRYLFEALGWYPVVWDGNSEEFGTEPAPTDCPDALYYAGWYSYGNYNDCFTWVTGAIGGHLDSYSAGTPRGEGSWAGEALIDGITATYGAVNEPYVTGMPEYDQVHLYLTQGASFAEAGYESTKMGAWMMLWIGDPWYRPYPTPTE